MPPVEALGATRRILRCGLRASLMKDIILLGAAVVIAAESLGTARIDNRLLQRSPRQSIEIQTRRPSC
jgi:Holliday junction resolvasome RuvABC ATP-dependent DNA helicase subunit